MTPRWTQAHAAVLGLALLWGAIGQTAVPLAITGAVMFGAMIWRARGDWTDAGTFGLANAITLARIGLAVIVAVLSPPHLVPWAGLGILVFFVLDGVDGYVARRTRTSSPFGAAFDMEADAFMVAVASITVVRAELLGPWILFVGALRYVFVIATATVEHPAEPPRRLGRWAFSALMCGLIGALVVPHRFTVGVLALGGVAVIVSFGRSFAWCFRQR